MHKEIFGSLFGNRFAKMGLFTALWGCVVLPVLAHKGAPPPGTPQVQPLAGLPQLVLPATDVRSELAADAQIGKGGPLRYAVARTVSITPDTAGTWEQLPDGRLWRLRVVSAGATDLNFGFTTFSMPEGAKLYILSESEDYYQGPYTAEHNADHGQLWTPMVPGSAATIELFVPSTVTSQPQLVLSQVSTGYRDVFNLAKDGSLPKGDTCEIDVTCPSGAPWANEIRSVACISIGGTEFCSATLVMDATADFRPFLLTANHCGITSGNASTVVAFWNYQSACGTHGTGVPAFPNTGSWSQNTSGSSFRAAKADVDFSLIELSSVPSGSYNVYYAGWDNSGSAPASGVGIHHPGAAGKCISFSAASPFTTVNSCIGTGGINTHWQVNWQNPPQGVTEPGSSGSGIWDAASHLVVGTLSGGPSTCSATPANLHDCYGKVSVSWTGGGALGTRLSDWLDPLGYGVSSMAGHNPAAPPSNDTCGGAIALTPGNTFIQDTTGATSAGDPVPSCGFSVNKGVWFTYTPYANGPVTVSTCGSSFDTVLTAYTGSCGALAEIACNDDFCSVQSQITFAGTAGVTYFIFVGGYESAFGTLHIQVALPNDACANAIPMIQGKTYTVDTTTATSAGDPSPNCAFNNLFGNGVWFTYTPSANGNVTVTTCGSGFDTVLGIYTGTCGSLTQIACDDDDGPDCNTVQASVAFAGSAGTTYYILAGGYNSGTGILQIKVDVPDVCSSALALLPGVPVIVDTSSATSTGDPSPSCAFNNLFGNGIWFTYTPTETAPVLVSSCGSSFDTVVGVYTGACGALTQIACDDDDGPDCATFQASVVFNATAGTTYHILAGGYNSDTGNLRIVAQLANDQCGGAVPLTTGVPFTMSTVDATSVGDPAPTCGAGVGKGVWFTYTAPGNGIVTLNTCGSSFDTVVEAFSGNCGALVPVGCDDDAGPGECAGNTLASFTQFPATSGTTYYILAGGYGGANGNLTILPNLVATSWNLNVSSFPNSVFIFTYPADTSSQSGANTPYTRTHANGVIVSLSAPGNDGFNVFQKWQLDGVDYSTSTDITVTMGANHTLLAVYVPPNDQCAGAIALTTAVPYTENTSGATLAGDPLASCGNGASNAVWFTYTPAISGIVTINTCGSDYDTVLEAYSGTCGALAGIVCDDDMGIGACPGNQLASFLEFPGTAGTAYHILCGGYNGATGNLSIVANVFTGAIRTLTVNSAPSNNVPIFPFPSDTTGAFLGFTPFTRTFIDGLTVTLLAQASDGFNIFQKWQLDGADYSTSQQPTLAMGADHTMTAVYTPPNDQCGGAIALSSGVPYDENTTTATSTGDAPANCGSLGNGVWFTYTPAVNGVVTINTCGSSYDTAVQAYTGTCAGLVPVAGGGCNDDSFSCPGNNYASYAEFAGTGGTTYYIQSGGFSGARGQLHIVANVVAPVNLSVNSTPNSGVGVSAVPADTGGNFGGNTTFGRTYGAGTVVTLGAPATDGFNVFQKWQVDGVDQPPGTTLSVAMNAGHNATAIYVSPNDQCAGAVALTDGVPYVMNTAGATSTGDPLVPCGPLQKGVWFTYTPTVHEEVTVSTCASDFDTMLQVFAGPCGALQRVAYGCDDDAGPSCGTTRASVVFSGFPGVTYYILAGGFAGNIGNLHIVATAALVNDDCTTALPLHFGVPFTMTTTDATTSVSESPVCRPQPNFGKGVWFTFNCPISGPVPISTCGSSFDTVIDVYTGTCGALASVACDDDNGPSCSGLQASVSITATAGTTYYILAGGFDALAGELHIMAGVPPTLTASLSGTSIQLSWPTYYYPYYLLQQQTGPMGIGSGTWQDILPNTFGGATFGPVSANPPTFYRLVTP